MKVIVRRVEPTDYEAVRDIFACPSVYRNTLQLPMPSTEVWKKRLAEPRENVHEFVGLVDGRVVGIVSLHAYSRDRRKHSGSFGIHVHDKYHRKGVATALMNTILDLADNWLGLMRVELTVYSDNAAATALYKKFGFEIEGTQRASALCDGIYVDEHMMARLRSSPSILAPTNDKAAPKRTRPRRK